MIRVTTETKNLVSTIIIVKNHTEIRTPILMDTIRTTMMTSIMMVMTTTMMTTIIITTMTTMNITTIRVA